MVRFFFNKNGQGKIVNERSEDATDWAILALITLNYTDIYFLFQYK